MKPDLRAVPTELPDPPYPSITKLNGYEPRIDWQRIRASKTWRLCPADQRNNLLRLWLESWNEYPCGSWEDDDELIAAAIDVPVRVFKAHKDILMRGWRRHSDGRFYHPFIAEKVLQMVDSRKSTAKRVAEWRNKKNQELMGNVTRYQHVSNATEKEKEKEKEKEDIPVLNNLHPVSPTKTAPKSGDSFGLAKRAPCPYQKILDLWAEMLPTLPQPVKLTPARRTQIRARWEDELPDLESWRECFGYVRESPFLMGNVDPPPGRKRFQASLEWVTKLDNLCKIYEGKYDGKARP